MRKSFVVLAALLSLSATACSHQYPGILTATKAQALPTRPGDQAVNLDTAAGITGPAGETHDNDLQFIPQFMR
jgi:hypothetical protein